MKKRSHFVAIMACAAVILSACSNKNEKSDNDYIFHGPPLITVFFAPLDGVSAADVEKLSTEFESNFAEKQWEPYQTMILEHSLVPDSCYNIHHTRYSATKVIGYLDSQYREEAAKRSKFTDSPMEYAYYVIGVTNADIATAVHGSDDYGILGLSFRGGNHSSVIISTRRLPHKRDLWKLAAHEFCHGFYGAPHCPNNDKHCIMCDAKGGNPHFEIKDSLCNDCANRCLIGD